MTANHTPDSRPSRDIAIAAFQTYRERILSFIRRRLRRPQDVEDALHDTYIRLSQIPEGQTLKNPEAYVFKIAANACNDILRAHRQRSTLAEDFKILAEATCSHRNEIVDGIIAVEEVRRTLAQLQPRLRAVFLLSRVYGQAPAEIARQRNLSTNTVRKYLWLATQIVMRRQREVTRVLIAGLAFLLLGAWPSGLLHTQQGPLSALDFQIYSAGEQPTQVLLMDGSLLQMNIRSRAQVSFSAALRQIWLLQGGALFVAKSDVLRPFVVTAGSLNIRAVGTQFKVNRQGRGATVSVVAGTIQVSPESLSFDAPTFTPMTLKTGEGFSIDDNGEMEIRVMDPAKSKAGSRRLVFRDSTLADIAAEFNRYSAMQIVVQDNAKEMRFSGTFNADDPQSFMDYLSATESGGDRLLSLVAPAALPAEELPPLMQHKSGALN